jgi:MFS family permease
MNPWRGLRQLPREIWILFAATLVNRCGTMVLPFLVLYLTRELKISASHAALALTVYGIAALLTMPVAGWLTDRFGSLFLIRGSLLLSGIVLFLFPLAHHFAAILAITFGFAILNESVRPPSLALVSELVKPHQRKQAFALAVWR